MQLTFQNSIGNYWQRIGENSQILETHHSPKILQSMDTLICQWIRAFSPRRRIMNWSTNTIFFVQKKDIPADQRKDVTYGKFVCEYKPNKTEQEWTRFTVGGDKINYPGDCATPTGDLLLFKIMLNSIISTQGARFMTLDIINFYLNTLMEQ